MHRIGEFFEFYAWIKAGWIFFLDQFENIRLNATHIVRSMNEFWSSLIVSLYLSVSLAEFCSFCRSICHVVHYILVELVDKFRCIRWYQRKSKTKKKTEPLNRYAMKMHRKIYTARHHTITQSFSVSHLCVRIRVREEESHTHKL